MKDFPVLTIRTFGEAVSLFYMDDLSCFLEKYPIFEIMHKQDFYMIVFIEEADGELWLDDQKIRLDQAKVVIIQPHYLSCMDVNRQAKGRVICFTEDFFSLRYNNNILYQFSFLQRAAKPYVRLGELEREKWKTLLTFTWQEFKANQKDCKVVLRSYLNILLFEMERLSLPSVNPKTKNIKREKIHEFEILIDKFFSVKKLPSDYAALLNISPNYLNKICKEETGQTAGDLIRKRIVIEAQRLLYHSSLSVAEIANELGFDTPSYFVTFFKNQTAITPEQFRKKQS
jgi:AraC-like DNA-binding protein